MRTLLYVFLILFAPLLVTAKPVVLATFPIPLMVENPHSGLFVNLTKEIAKRNSRDIEIVIFPTGKTLLAFSSGKIDGFFPALDVYVPKVAAKSAPFYNKIDYVFYKKSRPLKSLKDLEGKKVGLTFRYPYVKELTSNKKIKFEFAADDVVNMKKLGQGTIDAFVVEERSGLKALQMSGQKGIEFDKNAPLSEQTVYYAFQNSEQGRHLAEVFSKSIESMRKDGSLAKILNETP
ncbi:substrate-binding periplasmic protein [Bdellovibrio bacteriovorus]|uniref:substrate-binding periplasmic protein n=1 Tax=Bdellovibrio bacteriovorus TaxID=959 RepID=UPI0035A5EBBA